MLSTHTRTIIKATIPALESEGSAITKTFYHNMLKDNPSLLNIFNKANQQQGRQSTALAMTILAAAKNIDNLQVLLPVVKQIGHKHRSLQVQPMHYDIVGKYLLAAIKDVLGPVATPEILGAWGEAYKAIADIFIAVEKDMYQNAKWDSWKQFNVVGKKYVAKDILEFTVRPAVESGVDLSNMTITAGQYITTKAHPAIQNNENDILRHYSICSATLEDGLKFAVKYQHGIKDGLMSQYLHECVQIGDSIELSAPAGDFELNKSLVMQNEIPLVLVGAGVGVTPLISMLEFQISQNPERPIVWIQSSFDSENQAFNEKLKEIMSQSKNLIVKIIYTQSMPRINGAYLQENIPDNSDVYICGSIEFMSSLMGTLKDLGHDDQMVHYEPFGPKMSL